MHTRTCKSTQRVLFFLITMAMIGLNADLAAGAVEGRYIRYEAPANSRMEIHEIEVWSGGENIVAGNRNVALSGYGHMASRFEVQGQTGNQRMYRLIDGGEIRSLKAGMIEAQAEALLVYHATTGEAQLHGIALGCSTLAINGNPVKTTTPDFEFAMDATRPPHSSLALSPIYRPIEPVKIMPQEEVFTDSMQVSLSSATPEVEIRYTLDGSEPTASSSLYSKPITITQDTHVRTRAFRPGVKEIPFTADGTQVSIVNNARYRKQDLLPAARSSRAKLVRGLQWELVTDSWFALFTHLNLPDVMPAVAKGDTEMLLDVSMRQGDGPFGSLQREGLKKGADSGMMKPEQGKP